VALRRVFFAVESPFFAGKSPFFADSGVIARKNKSISV
jgi:hypothetical protein